MAYHLTMYDWELFTCVQEYELIYQANLDTFLQHFNQIQFWVVTEMVLCTNLSKRVSLLRKFIKLAAHCKEFQNLNSFFAIGMGLSNIAVSHLSQTWEFQYNPPKALTRYGSEHKSAGRTEGRTTQKQYPSAYGRG
ncbi:hypothetical protein DPMN_001778 [Dreissena polymorpha]|uniref:Ras-GEF domain-containing protein n=1 Tax=Dreissena polymorpha TaxID=45954 RepID=A0A9D4MK00_DREPO|nr:hypothetical protein DPMN_001778 [Dreissena polymorpha]